MLEPPEDTSLSVTSTTTKLKSILIEVVREEGGGACCSEGSVFNSELSVVCGCRQNFWRQHNGAIGGDSLITTIEDPKYS